MTENYSAIKVEVLIQPAMWINLVSMLSGKKKTDTTGHILYSPE